MKISKIHKNLMQWGKKTGCHQMVNRSLFLGGYQFPVCARCTGVLIGNISSVILIFIRTPNWKWLFLGCLIMFIDWLVQYLRIRESTNLRRLITGLLGGYSLTTLFLRMVRFIYRML